MKAQQLHAMVYKIFKILNDPDPNFMKKTRNSLPENID